MSELDTISTEFTEISTFVDSSVNYILKHAKKAIDENGCFNIVLCGGITPRLIYSKLAKSLENWHFWNFWF